MTQAMNIKCKCGHPIALHTYSENYQGCDECRCSFSLGEEYAKAYEIINNILLNLPQSELDLAREVWSNTNTRIVGDMLQSARDWLEKQK